MASKEGLGTKTQEPSLPIRSPAAFEDQPFGIGSTVDLPTGSSAAQGSTSTATALHTSAASQSAASVSDCNTAPATCGPPLSLARSLPSKSGQRLPEAHEGGLKRSFANLASSESAEAQGSPRRAFVLPADNTASSSLTLGAAAASSLFGCSPPYQDTVIDADHNSPPDFSGSTGDIPIAGLQIGPSNARKRDVPSTAWAPSLNLPHKQRLQDAEDGKACFSPSFPEESDRLRLMQMQLTDRQSSHAQASSTDAAWTSSQPAKLNGRGPQQGPPAARFQKATSPDVPEPPHKKGSGQGSSFEGTRVLVDNQPRRKQSDSTGLRDVPKSPQRSPGLTPVGSPVPLANGHAQSASMPDNKGDALSPSAVQAVSKLHAEGVACPSAEPLLPLANGNCEGVTRSELFTEFRGSAGASSLAEADAELAAQLKLARLLGCRGKPDAALRIAEQLVLQYPGNADALCLRGTCFAALNQRAQAFACFTAALNIDCSHLDTLLACGSLHKTCLLLPEAADMFRRAYEVQPNRADIQSLLAASLTDLGTKLKMAGNLDEGMANYKEAVSVCSSYGPAYYNIGVVWSEAKDFEKALEFYDKAVEAQPSHAEAHCNTGVIHKNAGRLDEAIAAYNRALAAAPNFQIVLSNLAIAVTEKATLLKSEGDIEKSIQLYERALTCNPRYTEALYNLAVAYGESRQLQKAAFMYEMALTVSPECAEANNNLGVIHRELGNMEKAQQCYMAALHTRPTFPQALNNVAVVYTAQGKAQDAHHMLMAAIAASPTYSEAYNNLGVLQRDVGAVKGAIEAYDKCLELQPDSRNAGQNRLLALNYIFPGELPMLCAAHEKWGIEFQSQFDQLPPLDPGKEEPDRPLVVGYISPDFFTHSVSYFAEAPLTHHSPDRVKLVAYNCTLNADSKTQRLKDAVEAGGGTWRDVALLSEQELAAMVREDGVDILVELTGHTANNRLGVMAQRPAPVQVTWIGYPNSTGLAAVDYRLTDMVCDPLDSEQTFVEELVHLPGCFLCYTPAHDAPPVSPLPALDLGFVTFGSFNALAKITPEVVRLWARLLLAVPKSRLLLKNKPSACQHARRHFLNQMESEGVSPERIDLLPLTAGNAEHLATYANMDISLDPFPYAGTTTTCESLYMGVPVVSLAGGCHAHNVGASLLSCLGLQDCWLAHTQEEYVSLAFAAAQDLSALGQLRAGLRERMLASPLCQAPAFVEQLEGVYRGLWQRWLSGVNKA